MSSLGKLIYPSPQPTRLSYKFRNNVVKDKGLSQYNFQVDFSLLTSFQIRALSKLQKEVRKKIKPLSLQLWVEGILLFLGPEECDFWLWADLGQCKDKGNNMPVIGGIQHRELVCALDPAPSL